MQSNTSHSSLRPFGWCVVLLLISTQSWGQETGCTSGNCVNGQGTLTYPDGTKYVGEWRDHKWHGQGTLTYANGHVDEGIWEDSKFIETLEEARQRELREAAARKQREQEESRRERIYNACLLDKSDGVDMSVRSLEMAVRETCIEISKNPSWLDKLRYE